MSEADDGEEGGRAEAAADGGGSILCVCVVSTREHETTPTDHHETERL